MRLGWKQKIYLEPGSMTCAEDFYLVLWDQPLVEMLGMFEGRGHTTRGAPVDDEIAFSWCV